MSRRRLVNRAAFDLAPLRPVGRRIYSRKRASKDPAQSTATIFFRNLEQLAALKGPLAPLMNAGRVRVLVAGCSVGCEAYTIAAYLAEGFPGLDWRIEGSDISHEALGVARAGVYGVEHGLGRPDGTLARALEARLFVREGKHWTIREEIAACVRFDHGDVLAPDFARGKSYDLVFGQNFMIHMRAPDAARAFAALVGTLRPGGALFAGGMDLDQRPALVAGHGLAPLDWNLAAIHDADDMRRSAWPWSYWSLEPIDRSAPDLLARYATIFLKASRGKLA